MMYSSLDIYLKFKAASRKPFRCPKDWDITLGKMTPPNKKALETITSFFNTKWRNIDVDNFMSCGFELFPNFTYTKFFDERIVNLYITKDKIKKRECDLDKRKIVESAKYIKSQMNSLGLPSLKHYARVRDEFSSLVIKDYLQNKVDAVLLAYLIHLKYLLPRDEDFAQMPYIFENMRSLRYKVISILDFLKMVEEKINGNV